MGFMSAVDFDGRDLVGSGREGRTMKKPIFSTLVLAAFLAGCAANRGQKNLDLIQASRVGDVSRVKTLIDEGADLNAVDPEGWTPYLAASAEGNWTVMKLLQEMGAKTDPGF
jgi:ankyrin repeat protein